MASYRIAVVGEKDSVLGFQALGLDVFPAGGADQARTALHRLAKENYAVIYLTEQLAANLEEDIPAHSRMVTSDDVFDYMLDLRALNQGIDETREERFQEYLDAKYANFQMRTLDDYQRLKQVNAARRKSQSQYVRSTLMGNARERSNGENAFRYFTEKIQDSGLYLLDEPENSLSPTRQMELTEYIENAARFFHCQFVISTHSPFLLSLRGAKIYDLDSDPVDVRRWTELENVRTYYDFFKKHEREFSDE